MSETPKPTHFITSLKFQWPGAKEWFEIELPENDHGYGLRSEVLSSIEHVCRKWAETKSADEAQTRIQDQAKQFQALIRYIRTTESQHLYVKELDIDSLVKRGN